ncbi:S-adenosyl-L-methionine-dependent methyltransferase [Gymnopilus junonius]|uniref:S-adenosyl-L-methionine-dependent methyltransferase n=1 Tax=Gymnopilus junonius TaxID=109634 RepID=A0A9P5TQC4_GYMJU|nr:S-adenosyl-L-methionine-dependent methyltransferase [Gymnopilus junonius]
MLAQSLSPTPRNPVSLLDLVDISTHALRLAEDNAKICAIQSQKNEKKPQNTFSVHQANFLAQDFSKFASRINPSFDIITSNPPYIPFDELLKLSPSVLDFEDPKALFGGPSGLEFYHAIAQLVSNEGILTPNATVALEVGHDQASSVENIMRATGRFRLTEIWLDPWGKQRTVIARA